MEEITTSGNSSLQLTAESQSFLKETAKWAYFLSIVGFVGIGMLILLSVFMGTIFSKLGVFNSGMSPAPTMGVGFITFLYLIMAVLYFFPVYYLFQFSSKAKAAFSRNDNEALTTSLEYLKSHYKFMGILAIIILSIYGVIFLFSIIGIAFASFR